MFLICDLKAADEEAFALSAQVLWCGFLFCSGETLALSVQGSAQWIDVLQYESGEALALSAQGFLLRIAVLLVVRLSHSLHKAVCSGALFRNLTAAKLSHFLYVACAVDYYFVNGEVLALHVQGLCAVNRYSNIWLWWSSCIFCARLVIW